MLKWQDIIAPVALIVFVASVYVLGYGSGRKAVEAEQALAAISMTDKSIVKLTEIDRTYDAILADIRSQKDDVSCAVAMPIRRAIELLPDGFN